MENYSETKNILLTIADYISETLPGYGFVLLTFDPFKPEESNYLSNEDKAIAFEAIKETVKRIKNKEIAKIK